MGPETGKTGQWRRHKLLLVALAFNISCPTYSSAFTFFSHLFFHLTLSSSFFFTHHLSFFLQPAQLDRCFSETTVDSVHLLLSSACYLSSPLENERGRFKNPEHLCMEGYVNFPKLANCTIDRRK